ncbi:condensation domain-containing protein [Streptomyces sp. NPDC091027]|uniref:condensation domain-containing protein n=1 Tax=Streptomyces sp. NPDC091027 TaxID=3365971 RepID=UPI00382F4859
MTDTMAMTVVLTPGPPTSLDLHGRLTPAALTAALALLPPCTPTLHRHTAHHHTLTLPPPPFPAGRLSDLLTGATAGDREHHTTRTPHPHTTPTDTPPTAPAPTGTGTGTAAPTAPEPDDPPPLTPLQHDLLLDAMTHPGAALHIGQLHWRWNGPLDTRRLTAAWQTLHDSEAVLRTALTAPTTPGSRPHLTVHPHATAHLQRHPRGSADWHTLLLAERMREFDLRHPGAALRIALLEEPDHAHRVLLTYHQALLDDWSARLLRRTLHRAYLADGRPAGSERRPDIRDHLRWTARQETAAARAYWARTTPPADAAGLPGPPHPPHPAPDAAHPPRGHGRNRHRLTPYEAMRLRTWAASRGAAESTALHAVWALQLHRATPHAPAVAFTATVSGRGIPLPGAERLPGPLRNAVPLHTPITPTTPLADVLATLTDQTLQASAYEWLPPTQHPPRPHPAPPAEPSRATRADAPQSATGRTSPDASVNEPSAEAGCPPPTPAGTDAAPHPAAVPGTAPADEPSSEAGRPAPTTAGTDTGPHPAAAPGTASGDEPSSEAGRPAPTTAGTDTGPHPATGPGAAPANAASCEASRATCADATPGEAPANTPQSATGRPSPDAEADASADEPSSEAGRPAPTTAGTDTGPHPATGPGAAPANEPSTAAAAACAAARPGPGPNDGPAKRPSPSAGRRPSVPAGAGPASRPGPGPHPGHSRAPGQGTRRDTLVTFEATAPPGSADDPVHAELAAEGIRIDPAEAVAAHTALLYTLTAHHDTEGGLVLTSVHDRSRITDTDAAETLAQTALLLRALPDTAGPTATVAQAVALLDAVPQPRTLAPTPASASARTLRILRAAARTGTGTICLVPPPDAPPTCYDALAAAYPGPQTLTTVAPPADARTVLAALRPALARGEPLLLGGFSGAGSLACEVAERIAAHGWHPPLVAIGGTLTTAQRGGPDPVRALARTLQTAVATTTRP